MTSFNCYWCNRFIGYSYKDNDVCDYCRSHRSKPPQSNAIPLTQQQLNQRVQNQIQWDKKHSFCAKLSKKGQTKLFILLIGIILMCMCIGFWLGLDDCDKTDSSYIIFGCVLGIGFVLSLVGIIWWCMNKDQNLKQQKQELI